MIRNYFKIALRNLARHKLFSFINIFGLALSMSVCMIVMIRIQDALSYDKFHPNADRTYRILSEIRNKNGDKLTLASTPLPLKASLNDKNNIVANVAQVYPAVSEKAEHAGKTIHVNGAFTDEAFFNVFGFELASGNKQTALRSPNTIVLNEETAVKFFGTGDALGKMLSFEKLGTFMVTGVINKTGKSHLRYEAYISASSIPQLEKAGKMPAKIDNWDSFEESYTYVQLSKDASPKELSAILGQVSALINNSSKSGSFSFSIQELNNITPSWLYLINDIGGGIGWSKIWAEIGIALLILVAACFNYTNLTIARALTRAKEVGIRKVSGAVRHQVFMQYIIESVVIALFALALAGVFLQLILTYKPFNDGYEMVPDLQPGISIFLWFMLFAVVTGAIAGAAPAWILSAFKPVQVLKNISTHKLFGNISLQKALIVFQFSLSLVIIIFLSSFYRQFSYMGVAEHGFNKDNILSISLNGADAKLLSAEAAGIAGVDNLTAVSGNFGRQATGIMYASPDKAHDYSIQLNYYFSDAGLIPTMGLKVVAGNNFPANTANDRERYILLNEKAVQAFKFSNNHDAVGKLIWLSDTTQVQVAGVIKDFYHAGVGRSIAPLAIRQLDGTYNFLNVYVNDPDKDAIAGRMAAAWKKVNPGKPFNYSWLGRDIYEMNAQTATMSLLGFLAFMAIAIASLGLLGLVIYTVETRRKEISIRKVIGASVQTLMVLLSGGFIKLLFIAGLIAMPTGYVLSVFFLQNFANRVPLGFGWVALCFMLLLVIGLVTILSQTYKASVANPVEHLKSE